MIELTDKTRVHGFWFCGARGIDWLAVVIKQGDGAWEAIYRFRYHVDDKTFDSDDEKHWYKIAPHGANPALYGPEAPAVLVQAMTNIAQKISIEFGSKLEYIDVRGDGHAAAVALSKTSFAELRSEPSVPGGGYDA